jgi:hypothetical protein
MSLAANPEALRGNLIRSLRALASQGAIALSTQPAGTVKADELALDFCHWLTACPPGEFTQVQRHALARVDLLLSQMSGASNAHLWTEAAVLESPQWAEVRGAAVDALRTMDS